MTLTVNQLRIVVIIISLFYVLAFTWSVVFVWSCFMAVGLACLLRSQLHKVFEDESFIKGSRQFIVKQYVFATLSNAVLAAIGPVVTAFFLIDSASKKAFPAQLHLDAIVYSKIVSHSNLLELNNYPLYQHLSSVQFLPYMGICLSLLTAVATAILCFLSMNIIAKRIIHLPFKITDLHSFNQILVINKAQTLGIPIGFCILCVFEFYLIQKMLEPSVLGLEFLTVIAACVFAIFLGPLVWLVFPLLFFSIIFSPQP